MEISEQYKYQNFLLPPAPSQTETQFIGTTPVLPLW